MRTLVGGYTGPAVPEVVVPVPPAASKPAPVVPASPAAKKPGPGGAAGGAKNVAAKGAAGGSKAEAAQKAAEKVAAEKAAAVAAAVAAAAAVATASSAAAVATAAAGPAGPLVGSTDGPNTLATLTAPIGVAVDTRGGGRVFITDKHAVRLLTFAGALFRDDRPSPFFRCDFCERGVGCFIAWLVLVQCLGVCTRAGDSLASARPGHSGSNHVGIVVGTVQFHWTFGNSVRHFLFFLPLFFFFSFFASTFIHGPLRARVCVCVIQHMNQLVVDTCLHVWPHLFRIKSTLTSALQEAAHAPATTRIIPPPVPPPDRYAELMANISAVISKPLTKKPPMSPKSFAYLSPSDQERELKRQAEPEEKEEYAWSHSCLFSVFCAGRCEFVTNVHVPFSFPCFFHKHTPQLCHSTDRRGQGGSCRASRAPSSAKCRRIVDALVGPTFSTCRHVFMTKYPHLERL